MTSFLDGSARGRGEIRFHLFGSRVRILPWFWLSTLILGASDDLGRALVWTGVCLVSILVHEFGHVFAFRSYGVKAEAMLYGFGGLAIPDKPVQRPGALPQVLISLAGPFAGFCFGILIANAIIMAGGHVNLGVQMGVLPDFSAFLPPRHLPPDRADYYLNVAINDLLYVNIYWGLVNLLPVFPLDGGQVARALLVRINPFHGKHWSLLLSLIVSGALAAAGAVQRQPFLIMLFGLLAFSSFQGLRAARQQREAPPPIPEPPPE